MQKVLIFFEKFFIFSKKWKNYLYYKVFCGEIQPFFTVFKKKMPLKSRGIQLRAAQII